MKHKVSELEGNLLDAAVAKAEGDRLPDYWRDPEDGTPWLRPGREEWHPSDRWDQGGPIIERERIALVNVFADQWEAYVDGALDYGIEANPSTGVGSGITPLIAAMRAYVASKLGEEIELP